jgi:hypothetical protein
MLKLGQFLGLNYKDVALINEVEIMTFLRTWFESRIGTVGKAFWKMGKSRNILSLNI